MLCRSRSDRKLYFEVTEYWSCLEQIKLKVATNGYNVFQVIGDHDLSEFEITEIRLYLLVNTVYVICLLRVRDKRNRTVFPCL